MHEADDADLYSAEGKLGISPVILAFVSVLQFLEKLCDRQAAQALWMCLDWKYALHLLLEYEGFDFSVLSEFCLVLYKITVVSHGQLPCLQVVLPLTPGQIIAVDEMINADFSDQLAATSTELRHAISARMNLSQSPWGHKRVALIGDSFSFSSPSIICQ